MKWLKRIVKKVIVEPIEAVVIKPIVEYVVEPITEHVIEPFVDNILEPIVDSLSSNLNGLIDNVGSLLGAAGDSFQKFLAKCSEIVTSEILIDALKYIVEKGSDWLVSFASSFVPVDGAELKQHETIYVDDWSNSELHTVRDVVALTQVAFADFSELHEKKAVDSDGKVIDESLIYAYEEWHTGIESWVQDGFEILRVKETSGCLFEVNVVLFKSKEAGKDEYTIGIGGTDGIIDVLTDFHLGFLGGTPGNGAISDIIDGFFQNDIVLGEETPVDLVGVSLGGAEALQQYIKTPDLFDDVFVFNSAGLGGVPGTFYDTFIWDGIGDSKITEINSNDPDEYFDVNDLVTMGGFIGAGQTFEIGAVNASTEIPTNELMDSHQNHAFWASLPGGEYVVNDVVLA